MFFHNPISIALALIGASLPDFDHNIKKNNLYNCLIIGLILFIILYIFELPYYIGIIVCIIPIIFYFSNHRGFTHSLLGIIFLSLLIFLVVILGSSIIDLLLNSFLVSNSQFLALSIVVLGLAIMFLNKKLLIPFIIIFLLAIVLILSLNSSNLLFESILNINDVEFVFNSYLILFPIFLGLLSHLILDSLTPSGIELFRPFSSKRVYKKFGIFCLFLVGFLAILWWNFVLFVL
ncbi:MAG: metal-dependent hydrolase [Methanobrevibacter sp.]|nr:metal-dependent hydrolase [Methanobrevibacter sp.]